MIKTIKLLTVQRDRVTTQQYQYQYQWQIIDEKGQQRVIYAYVSLDADHYPKQFRAANIREMPLVEALLKHQPGDVFTIDFTEFNKRHCYDGRMPYQKTHHPFPNQGLLFKDKANATDDITVHGFL